MHLSVLLRGYSTRPRRRVSAAVVLGQKIPRISRTARLLLKERSEKEQTPRKNLDTRFFGKGNSLESIFGQDNFFERHVGPDFQDTRMMLSRVGYDSMEAFIAAVLPFDLAEYQAGVAMPGFPPPVTEMQVQKLMRGFASMNNIKRCYIGLGYYGTVTPAVIRRAIMENPSWYTQYTPYQSEISQGRLESLLNFQTLITELTALPIANASLLDEATAAGEAMVMLYKSSGADKNTFLVDKAAFPQTIACLATRADPLGIQIKTFERDQLCATLASRSTLESVFGIYMQYPDAYGSVHSIEETMEKAKEHGLLIACAADLLALAIVKPPGEMGADVVVGSTQRFGVPMGYGGPHAAYLACSAHFKRALPGRVVGVSRDALGNRALRLALQTREQHIRREKATSNICTSQALLANVAAMYAIYHGPHGLVKIAKRVHQQSVLLARIAERLGHSVVHKQFFDTVLIRLNTQTVSISEVQKASRQYGVVFRHLPDNVISVSLDETVQEKDFSAIIRILGGGKSHKGSSGDFQDCLKAEGRLGVPAGMTRETKFMQQSVFNSYHSETELLRYIDELQCKDLSLAQSMIPLGSCTMKLNAATEMMATGMPGFSMMHPFAPLSDAQGYQALLGELRSFICAVTGFKAISLMPNSGSQGEFAGLCVIRAYHKSKQESQRDVCMMPVSAHGTNPASAMMAGMRVVTIKCDQQGNISLEDLAAKISIHRDRLAAIMITYPCTFGVFDTGVQKVISMVHASGGLVYLDGANMNAQMGYCRPADLGADVCHLNLHKTFCIPHGGGGPGAGPIGVASFLEPFLPAHVMLELEGTSCRSIGAVSAAPFGSASILPISWAYMRMMGEGGLRGCSEMALLNANYVMKRLEEHYKVLFKNHAGLCAHEFILDCRPFKETAGIDATDIAKRLQVPDTACCALIL